MDNKNSYALKITTGAMILAIFAILLLINRQTGAFFEEFFIYLLPIPMVAYASRYGLKSSLPVFVGMLAFSFFFGTLTTFFYAGTAALLGMIFGTRIFHKRDLTQTMLIVMVLSTVFNVLSTIALASVFGYDLVREINEMQDMMTQVVSQTGADPQAYAPMLEGGYIKQLIVISAVIFGMIQGYIIYVLSLLILKRLRFQVPKARPITLLYPPKWTGLAAIALFLIGFRSFTGTAQNETVQRLLQCGWTIGYLYLIVFGVIALYLVIRKYLFKYTALAVILAILGTLIFPQLMMILGFVYITTSMHDRLLEPRQSRQKKPYAPNLAQSGGSHAISDKLDKVNMRPQNMDIDELFSEPESTGTSGSTETPALSGGTETRNPSDNSETGNPM